MVALSFCLRDLAALQPCTFGPHCKSELLQSAIPPQSRCLIMLFLRRRTDTLFDRVSCALFCGAQLAKYVIMDLKYHSFRPCATVFSSIIFGKTAFLLVLIYRLFTKTMEVRNKLGPYRSGKRVPRPGKAVSEGRNISHEFSETRFFSLPVSPLSARRRRPCVRGRRGPGSVQRVF